jgi:hypothetical protein
MLRLGFVAATLMLIAGCSSQTWTWMGREAVTQLVQDDADIPPNKKTACELEFRCDPTE